MHLWSVLCAYYRCLAVVLITLSVKSAVNANPDNNYKPFVLNTGFRCETNQTRSQMRPDLSVQLITWNVKSEQCKCDLTQLLDIDVDDPSVGHTSAGQQPLADVYAIGLQEVAFRPTSLVFTDPWVTALDKLFRQLDYVRLKQIRLVGILLVVYTRRQLLPRFRSVETQYTRTGFGGLWGNKGGVSVSLIMDGVSLCIVNTHLAPHYENLDQRIADYNTIVDGQYFWSNKKPNILSHDYVLWMGDLNFRIDELTGDEIHDIIVKAAQTSGGSNCDNNKYKRLLDEDQLNRVRLEGRAFSEFTETAPTFAPTYKFFVNTDEYDYKSRKPAFTDRILYRFTANAYENTTLDLQQLNYTSHPQYKQSDHKPVSALFHLKTRQLVLQSIRKKRRVGCLGPTRVARDVEDSSDQNSGAEDNTVDIDRQIHVTFRPISDWRVNRDAIAWFTITPNDDSAVDTIAPWDWIGLYKSDFLSTDELLSYVWVNPVPTRWSPPPESGAEEQSDTENDGESADAGPPAMDEHSEPWFSVQFAAETLLIADRFRLVYLTQAGDVLGVSEPFVITN